MLRVTPNFTRPLALRDTFWAFALLLISINVPGRAKYVSPSDFDINTLLPTPPAVGSEQSNSEIDLMLKLQSERTKADVKRLKLESKMTPFIFADSLGSWFNPDDLPLTAAFLSDVDEDAHKVCSSAKEDFQRHRPFKVDDRIHPCVENEKTFSYPSRHSTCSMVLAMTIAELVPDQKDAAMALGRKIGDDRILAGQHFPSDVAAGRVLAAAIFAKMQQNPDFQTALAKAKQECQAKESKTIAAPTTMPTTVPAQ